MTAENFVYWLQGYLEISSAKANGGKDGTTITPPEVKVIQDHLALVLYKVTPSAHPVMTTLQEALDSMRNTRIEKIIHDKYDLKPTITCSTDSGQPSTLECARGLEEVVAQGVYTGKLC